jgi:outer membrane protein assembly factor BamB
MHSAAPKGTSFLLLGSIAFAQQWAQYGFDGPHSFRVPYNSIVSSAAVKWNVSGTDWGSAPVIDNAGTVYVCNTYTDQMMALDGNTGSTLWAAANGCNQAAAVNGNGMLFYATGRGETVAASTVDGSIQWSFLYGSSPALRADGTVVVGGCIFGPMLYAIDSATGTQLWNYSINGTCGTANAPPPAVSPDGRVFFVIASKTMTALSPDGTLLWQIVGDYTGAPSYDADSDMLFCVTQSSVGGVIAIQAATGITVWNVTVPNSALGIAIGAPGLTGWVVATTYWGTLNAFNIATGAVLWVSPTGFGGFTSSPVVTADGIVCAMSVVSSLACVDSSGTLLWQLGTTAGFDTVNSSPLAIAANGNIYFTGSISGNAVVVCIEGTIGGVRTIPPCAL